MQMKGRRWTKYQKKARNEHKQLQFWTRLVSSKLLVDTGLAFAPVDAMAPHKKAKDCKFLLDEHDASRTKEVRHKAHHQEDPNNVSNHRPRA